MVAFGRGALIALADQRGSRDHRNDLLPLARGVQRVSHSGQNPLQPNIQCPTCSEIVFILVADRSIDVCRSKGDIGREARS
jgi:hypothetical protein